MSYTPPVHWRQAGGHFTSSIIDAFRFEIPDYVTIYWLLMRRTAKKKPDIFLVNLASVKRSLRFFDSILLQSFLGHSGFSRQHSELFLRLQAMFLCLCYN